MSRFTITLSSYLKHYSTLAPLTPPHAHFFHHAQRKTSKTSNSRSLRRQAHHCLLRRSIQLYISLLSLDCPNPRWSALTNSPSQIMFSLLTRILTPTTLYHQQSPIAISIRTATKKAGGSSNNGRDSIGRRLGIKVWPGRVAIPGNIIVRWVPSKWSLLVTVSLFWVGMHADNDFNYNVCLS
jgi:hypothetical protein